MALDDPNEVPSAMNTQVVGSMAPVLAGSGSDTIFFLYGSSSGLTSSSPRIVRIQLYDTTGTLKATGTASITASNSIAIVSATTLGATGDGVAVLTSGTTGGAGDTTGHYAGSALYVDATLGTTYERSLVVGRGETANWPGFSSGHVGTYIEISGSFATQLHIVCPGNTLSIGTLSELATRLHALGNFPHLGSGTATRGFQLTVWDVSGTLVGSSAPSTNSCDAKNFRNTAASTLSTNFTTGVAGLFLLQASQGATTAAAKGDLIVWRIISLTSSTFAFDERLQIFRDPINTTVTVTVGRST